MEKYSNDYEKYCKNLNLKLKQLAFNITKICLCCESDKVHLDIEREIQGKER